MRALIVATTAVALAIGITCEAYDAANSTTIGPEIVGTIVVKRPKLYKLNWIFTNKLKPESEFRYLRQVTADANLLTGFSAVPNYTDVFNLSSCKQMELKLKIIHGKISKESTMLIPCSNGTVTVNEMMMSFTKD